MAHSPDKATLEERLTNLMKKANPAPTPKRTAGPELAPNRSRTLHLTLAFLTVLLFFSIAQVQPQPPTITGPIAAITVETEPEIQTAVLSDATVPMTVIQHQTGFHCYAGCSLFHPKQPSTQLTKNQSQGI